MLHQKYFRVLLTTLAKLFPYPSRYDTILIKLNQLLYKFKLNLHFKYIRPFTKIFHAVTSCCIFLFRVFQINN